MDYRKLFVSKYLAAGDLEGDRIFTIRAITQEPVESASGTETCPIVYLVEFAKPFVMNKTNGKRIAAMYGVDTDQWVGKQITLYASETTYKSEVVPCIRVRPGMPATPAAPVVAATPAAAVA